jgi:hypothetical protein
VSAAIKCQAEVAGTASSRSSASQQGGKQSAADVIAKAQAVLSESELLRAMFDVGYFPPSTPPDE